MKMTFRCLLIAVALLMNSGNWAVFHVGAQSGDEEDTFETYGAEPRPLPEDAVDMVVDSVVDGDTLHLNYPDNDWYYRVRVIGIDAPEKAGPYTAAECYGDQASSALAELLPAGTIVLVERDVTDEDRNGRWLRHVWLPYAVDGEDIEDDAYLVSEILVRGGWVDARTYRPDDKYDEILMKAERDAKKVNEGLWGACDL